MKHYYLLKTTGIIVEVIDEYCHPIAPKTLVMRAGNTPSTAQWVNSSDIAPLSNKDLIGLITDNYTVIPA